MEYKDYYQVMGLKNTASQAEIKRAYKKLARKHHPDISKAHNAEVKFKELSEAYEVLKDPKKRVAYDQLGSNWKSGQPFRPPPNWDQGFEYSDSGRSHNFSDFLNLFLVDQMHSPVIKIIAQAQLIKGMAMIIMQKSLSILKMPSMGQPAQ